ncbi:hypothetical protein KI387_001251, partial [Taxus chinensis]
PRGDNLQFGIRALLCSCGSPKSYRRNSGHAMQLTEPELPCVGTWNMSDTPQNPKGCFDVFGSRNPEIIAVG